MPPLLVPPARVVLTAPELEVPFLCLAPPPPPARGEEVPPPRGLPAPTLVALAAGPGIVCLYGGCGLDAVCLVGVREQEIVSVDSVELSCVLSVVLCRVVTADTANVTLPSLLTGALIGRTNLCWNCVSQYKRFLQIWNRSQSYLAWILYLQCIQRNILMR